MKNFKVIVTKGTKKFTFIKSSENEITLRDELHKEGFSIATIEAMDSIEVEGEKYYFEIIQNGALKTGRISSNDIFKAFLKLKYELNYDLKYIFPEKETSLEEKERIIHDLEEQYEIYKKTSKDEINNEEKAEKEKTKKVEEISTSNFQMKKELEETYKIIDRVITKLKFFINLKDNEFIDFEKREKLNQIYFEIVKLKSSTNVFKLRQVGELGLLKIGEIELKILEEKKNDEVRKLLKETNSLLRHVGSKKSFVEKEKDVLYILKNLFLNIKKEISIEKKIKHKVQIDKKSSNYLKTKSLIEKYSSKLQELNTDILKNFIIFIIPTKANLEQKELFLLKKKVIRQNLSILKAKLKGSTFSYVKIVKGYNYFVAKLIEGLDFLKFPLFTVSIIYSFSFFIFNILNYFNILSINLNYKGMFYFLIFMFIYILLSLTRGVLSLIFNIVILSFIFIFGVINF